LEKKKIARLARTGGPFYSKTLKISAIPSKSRQTGVYVALALVIAVIFC